MRNLFRKLLGKSEAPAVGPRVVANAVPHAVRPAMAQAHGAPQTLQAMPPAQPVLQVEVAQLSLAAILGKFPEDLKQLIGNMPDPAVTVALPLATIQKQLPTGSVKMSLASLVRQAPVGTFTQARMEDRRMVEVPLPEIFRHVNPGLLARREQRRLDLPEDAVGLFGDSSNPHVMAPGAGQENGRAAVASPNGQRSVAAPVDFRPKTAPQASPAPAQPTEPAPQPARVVSPPSGFPMPSSKAAPAPAPEGPPLEIRIADLAAGWPDPMRSEALAMGEATVALPSGPVTSGLARGKVIFSWGQLRSWLNPAPTAPTEGREETELMLPLKVVAPAFLSHSRPKAPRKSVSIDETIPALFNGATPEPPPAPAAEPEPEAPVEQQSADLPVPVVPAIPLAATIPSVIAPPLSLVPAPTEPAPTPEAPAPSPASIFDAPKLEPVVLPVATTQVDLPTPAAEVPVTPQFTILPPPTETIPAPGHREAKKSIGEILGDPEKTHWSPPELVKATVRLPGVAGAVVALQEGLLVAAHLPEEMKGDTVAAFLPQIFARLSNYAGEMKLGTVDDVLFTTNGAHFKIFRLGEVYFAILGKPGESLPWDSLRCIAEELGDNHQK